MGAFAPPQGATMNPVGLRETTAAGQANVDQGELLTKDVSGRTELFYEDDTGAQVQMTSAGGLKGVPQSFSGFSG